MKEKPKPYCMACASEVMEREAKKAEPNDK
jgi:hypothetical protein